MRPVDAINGVVEDASYLTFGRLIPILQVRRTRRGGGVTPCSFGTQALATKLENFGD